MTYVCASYRGGGHGAKAGYLYLARVDPFPTGRMPSGGAIEDSEYTRINRVARRKYTQAHQDAYRNIAIYL